jgi:16S rRNA U516 pseudouridylate synthase RsuA-like enzyme
MANKLTHPRYGHTKTYKVIVYGLPSGETLDKWRNGVYLDDGKTAPCVVEVSNHGGGLATLKIVMKEGKKRQIRRVASILGHPVKRLIRTHIGRLSIGKLRTGEWYELSPAEVTALQTPAEELQVIRHATRRAPSVKAKSSKPPSKKPLRAKTSQRKRIGKSDTGRSRKR